MNRIIFMLFLISFSYLEAMSDIIIRRTSKIRKETQVKAIINDSREDQSKDLMPILMMVSDLDGGKKKRPNFIAHPEQFKDLKNGSYQQCSLIGLTVLSPFLDDTEKSEMLKACHKIGISSTAPDRALESDFVLTRHKELITFLCCLHFKNKKGELPSVPKDVLGVILSFLPPEKEKEAK